MALGWGVDSGSDSLNKLISASTASEQALIREQEFENTLFNLKQSHIEELAKQQLEADRRRAEALVKQDRVASDKDYKQRLESIRKIAEAEYNQKVAAHAENEALYKEEMEQKIALQQKELDAKWKKDKAYIDKLNKYKDKIDAERQKQKEKEEARAKGKKLVDETKGAIFGSGKTLSERTSALKNAFKDENGITNLKQGFATLGVSLVSGLSDIAKQLDNTIESIAGKRSVIDTRLQGSKRATSSGSYWDAMSKTITGAAAVSPYIKQADIVSNLESMVKSGVAFNVEERAFLQTVKAKIADTFDANDSVLRRLIRIQEQDSTAARLGMESALTTFLNNMYETTEYMSEVANGIKHSIEEASALMGVSGAVEFEYQVQKWMGSLYSVGMSNSGVSNIASAIGQIASGNLAGLNSGAGKLLMMAANQAGLSISDMLASGLNSSDVNTLMNSAVNYLATIANQTADNLVVQQQLAGIFGLTASDIRSAKSLSRSINAVNTNGLSYSGAMGQLYNMANSMYKRTSIGEMMTNTWDNLKYSMAAGIASNPALYGIYKVAGLLDTVAGGIALPDIKVLGSGVNLQTTVADLMRVASLSGGIISSLGQVMSAGGNGGITGNGLLNAFGVGRGTAVQRGTGSGLITSNGATVSQSGYVGNSDSGDIIGKTTGDAQAAGQQSLVEAQDSSEEVSNKTINDNIVLIYELLQNVTSGAAALHVIQEDFGLSGGLH